MPISITEKFKSVNEMHDHATRSATRNDMYIPKCKTNMGQKNFMVRGPVEWGDIPADIKGIFDRNDFKQILYTYSLTQQGKGG